MIILITGASSGIGRSLALYYLNQGNTVAAVARRKEKLIELYQEVQSLQGTLKIYPGDVTDKQCMAEIITAIEIDLGSLDLVIANAGIANQHLTANLDLEAFEQIIQTNVIGVFNTLVPTIDVMMRHHRGHIVTISSLAAFNSIPRIASYCASKTALNYQLTGLYWTLKPYGINVTTICPGFIATEMAVGQQVPKYWCLEVNQAVEIIAKAIAKKRRLYCFPFWQFQLIKTIDILPNTIKGFVFNVLIEKYFPRPNFLNY
jgi:short-subunit dehydrogenase